MRFPKIIRCKNEAEWLARRAKGIGASDCPTVLGLNPYKSALELWAEKTGKVEPADLSKVEAVQWGHKLEPAIARAYMKETGRAIRNPGEYTIYRPPEIEWLLATPDRLVKETKTRPLGDLQIKTVGVHMAGQWEDEPPAYVQAQVQHEMAAMGVEWGSIAALIGGQRFLWKDLDLHDTFIEWMLGQLSAFWDLVQRDIPPEPDASESARETLHKMFPRHVRKVIVAMPSTACELDEQLVRYKRAATKLKARISERENKIKQIIGEAEVGQLPDGTQYTWKASEVAEHVVKAHTKRTLLRKKGKAK